VGSLEIVIALVVLLAGFGEFYAWYSESLWHSEDRKAKGDRRNWGP